MEPEWISVVERLPKPGVFVLVWWNVPVNTRYLVAYLGENGEWHSAFEGALISDVTHWRALPVPP